MKRFSAIALFTLLFVSVQACPVCEKQQPKLLRGITHGAGPQSSWDYLIVWATVIIVAITLLLSVWYLVKPGEKNINHIKRVVIN